MNRRKDVQNTIENEARAIAKLCDSQKTHRNIVEVYRCGRIEKTGMLYIDMLLCDSSLEDFIQSHYSNRKQIEMPLIWRIMEHIASGVAFIHEHREVHRDLKPQNSLN